MPVVSLRLGFYGEGNTDDRFLPPIVERTARRILNARGRYEVDVMESFLVSRTATADCSSGEERILQAARETMGYDALIIHLDADAPDLDRTLTQRFAPGARTVMGTKERVCRRLIPLIPVRMSEAWMIADWETLTKRLNPDLKWDELRALKEIDLPNKPHEVESNLDPKQTLRQIIDYSQARRRRAGRNVDMRAIQSELGRLIRLEELEKVPAYRRFVDEMTRTLISLGMVE